MADTLYHTPEGQPFVLSMSFGYSACHVAADLNRALQMADRALYDAKDAGRNCVHPALPASIPCHS
ncbi:diguanylate cyclase domain-containing protein [Laribacter hongkongensis]|uniref:diguanylate cyclase domain-containing protein n=1 Tax=Laribacter hongkongensis TaxID=168471 RepID=UPI0024582C39|nr:diguanylate cyclase [Laribacter hongkongensis]